MARRRQSSFFEDLTVIVSKLPWWAGLLIALISYLWLHHAATQTTPPSPQDIEQLGDYVSNQIWVTIATFMHYILPAICVVGASISAFKQYKNSKVDQRSLSEPEGDRHQRQNTNTATPDCPICSSPMVKRIASKGERAGKAFWGCSKYPACKGTRSTT